MLDYAVPMRNDLRLIASRQKGLIYCILGYIVGIMLLMMPAADSMAALLKVMAGFTILAAVITAAVFAFMLAIALYGTGPGVAMGIFTLIPYIGIIFLLRVNAKATKVLRQHGVRVGFMGARLSDVPTGPPQPPV